MQKSMRAAVLLAPGEVRIESVPIPEPAEGEVRIRLEGCGVCASNLATWAGLPWLTYPGEAGGLGHEAWGYIDAIGGSVNGLEVGERVAAISFKAFAEYDLADACRIVRLPATLADAPVPGEPLGCAFNIFRRSDIARGQTVAIIGIGFLGAILTKLAADAGARVIAISRRRASLDLAQRYGAAHVIEMADHYAIIDQVRQITENQMCNRVIEAVGKQWPLDLAGELIAEGGKLIIAGYHQDGPRQINMQGWNWKGIDVVNAHERDFNVCVNGMRQAIDAVSSGQLDPTPLYTHTYPLERLGAALDATRDKPGNFIKALVTFD